MDNRSKILQCALELFAARGYDAVGVQEVAEASGITKPTLYHYYGNKQGLLKALLETYFEPFNQSVQQAARYEHDLTFSLEKVARAYFDFATQNPVYYRLQLGLWFAPHDSEGHQLVTVFNTVQFSIIEELFAAAASDHGNMRGRQRLYTTTFLGMLNTCIGMWLNGYAPLDDQLLYSALHQFQHGIYS
jgi:TetR/AcrR family transcriptional regulator